MVDIPEERQAAALRRVAEIGSERAELLARAEELIEPLRQAAVEAAKIGAQRSRIKELARISPNTLTAWLSAAGLEIRAKAPAKKASQAPARPNPLTTRRQPPAGKRGTAQA